MTNEDALNDMLRKAFPRMVFIRSIDEKNRTQAIHFTEEWLNAEYKAESNEMVDLNNPCSTCKYGKNKTVLRCRECESHWWKNYEPRTESEEK